MEISNNTNNYQTLSSQQQAVTLPIEPQEPEYTNGDIYKASQGNAIRNKDGDIVLTPQGENALNQKEAKNLADEEAAATAQKDSQRATATGYLAYKSQKSQVEIYLAVATDGKSSSSDSTASVIESLRDVQKQNDAVAAYATYRENQNGNKPILF